MLNSDQACTTGRLSRDCLSNGNRASVSEHDDLVLLLIGATGVDEVVGASVELSCEGM